MKSLNRTLSLVLVLVMVFGLFGVASAATTFTDTSSVTYKEAVNVMTGIGVIAGMGDGTFQPTGDLTREQAAKIICYMTVGKTVADALKADVAPFTDVNANRWSAGYIAYCVKSGVLSGMGDGTFAPEANVTGYQFAKMLLVALGYDASKESFTGSSWSINVAKLAFKTALFAGNDAFDGNKAVSRQEACLYAFNTLTATEVEYKTAGTSITVGGTTIVTGGSTASAVTRTVGTKYTGGAEDATGTMQFCEDHFPKLTLVAASTDAFMRTANKWYYGTVQTADTLIGTYGAAANYKFVVADPVNYNTLAKIKTAVNTSLVIDAAGTFATKDYTIRAR